MRLKDKVAIVTGGGGAIGESICLGFAREGADIVIPDINLAGAENTVKKVKEMGRRAMAINCDVTKSSDINRMVTEVVMKEFGRIDILANVAGGAKGAMVDELEMTEQQWDAIFNLNLKSAFLCTQAVARIMIKQRSGNIINISSGASLAPRPGLAHYGAAKAALNHLSRTFSVVLGPHGIRVNIIAPGSVSTPASDKERSKTPELYKERLSRTPLGSRAKPEDIAEAAIFLATDASSYVTGTIIKVDGGLYA